MILSREERERLSKNPFIGNSVKIVEEDETKQIQEEENKGKHEQKKDAQKPTKSLWDEKLDILLSEQPKKYIRNRNRNKIANNLTGGMIII